VWLDATGLERFAQRFPTIAAAVAEVGLDPAKDWLPVAPAAHYTCGGIVADLDGASSLPGLWVAGEAACNGVHGANRLASNSLLDGMVFGPRVVEAVERGKDGPDATGAMRAVVEPGIEVNGNGAIGAIRLDIGPEAPLAGAPAPAGSAAEKGLAEARAALQRTMTADAGVLRSAGSLGRARTAAVQARGVADQGEAKAEDATARHELANLALVGQALCRAALAREETRGAHARSDFPHTSESLRVRFVIGG
jgi:L-aspartate oxidase